MNDGRRILRVAACARGRTIVPGCAPLAATGDSATIAPRVPAAVPIDDDELVLLIIHPSPWFVPLACLGSLAAIVCAVLAMAWATRFPFVPWTDGQVFGLGAVIAVARLAWQVVDWTQRLYVLTDRRAMRRGGVLRSRVDQLALRDVRHTVILAPPRERRLDVGTILFASGGSSGLAWECVRRPGEVQGLVREAIERYG